MRRVAISICCLLFISLHLNACRVAQVLSTQYSQNIASAAYGTEANHPWCERWKSQNTRDASSAKRTQFYHSIRGCPSRPKNRHPQWKSLSICDGLSEQ